MWLDKDQDNNKIMLKSEITFIKINHNNLSKATFLIFWTKMLCLVFKYFF